MDPTQLPLRDLHLPAQVGWWPLAPGWWVLLAILAVGLLYLAYRAWRRFRYNRARRVALSRLAQIEQQFAASGDATALGLEVSELLRRVMLAYAPRHEVAGLTGQAWLEWLNRGLDDDLFVAGPGRALGTLPYRPREAAGDVDVAGLLQAVRVRLRTPMLEAAS